MLWAGSDRSPRWAEASREAMGRGRRSLLLGLALAGALGLQACVPLAVTGAAVGGMSAFDRRTLGAQADDQAIELRSVDRIRQEVPRGDGISVTSYNRKVLLTGIAPDEATRAAAEQAVSRVANVRSVHNEIQIGVKPSFAVSTNDAALTTKVKAALLDAKDLQSNAFKVLTESGTVYLLGLVTRREGDRAADVASRVAGVQRVVTVFEYLTEQELGNLGRNPQPGAGGDSSAQPSR